MVRPGRCAGVVCREGVPSAMLASVSMDEKSKGREGEPKVLDEARENSDSERLRFKTMVAGGSDSGLSLDT